MRAFRLAYDGAPYAGFQRQPDVPTVEGALLSGLDELGLLAEDGGPPSGYAAAGRTDAGVSALAQTVAFECPDWCSPSALNGALPEAVRAWASAEAPDGFHATADARERTYVYHLYAPDADDEGLRTAAARLAGEHDLGDLTPDDRGTVRELAVDLARDGDFVEVRVSADGFPRQLVRRLVSLLADVGTGERPPDAVDRVLGPDPLPGHRGVPPAPAYPLVLVDVAYDLSFVPDPDGVDAARALFEARRVEHAARARVAGAIRSGL